jgi:hypothetical protein
LFIGLTTIVCAQAAHPASTDPAQKAKALQKQLKLSDDQTVKVTAIYEESSQKFDKIKTKEHGDTNKMMADIGPLRTETIAKIKGVLTPNQAVEYDKLVKQTPNSTLNSGWSDGWSSTASGN